jgi:hypothetical protein
VAGLRALQQSTPKVTAVSTPQQLLDAASRGDAHIEIRQHLDLTTATPLEPVPRILGGLPSSVQSIRVRYHSMLLMHSAGMLHACKAVLHALHTARHAAHALCENAACMLHCSPQCGGSFLGAEASRVMPYLQALSCQTFTQC